MCSCRYANILYSPIATLLQLQICQYIIQSYSNAFAVADMLIYFNRNLQLSHDGPAATLVQLQMLGFQQVPPFAHVGRHIAVISKRTMFGTY